MISLLLFVESEDVPRNCSGENVPVFEREARVKFSYHSSVNLSVGVGVIFW